MLVKASPGLQVPREEDPRTYIGEEPVEIAPTGYYIRRLADGDLVEVQPRPLPAPAAAPAAGAKSGAKG
ncbi:MAG: DUF2635 domain-containing protein [Betaproteobacteria bacterium]|jgi:hypothetical protein